MVEVWSIISHFSNFSQSLGERTNTFYEQMKYHKMKMKVSVENEKSQEEKNVLSNAHFENKHAQECPH